MPNQPITAFFDGSCQLHRGVWGQASYGAIIFRGSGKIWECSSLFEPKIPVETSNNLAEYCGFGVTLKYLKENNLDDLNITIYGDSKLVIEQMSGRWKIRNGVYIPFANRARDLLATFRVQPKLVWIPREQNLIADRLSKVQK